MKGGRKGGRRGGREGEERERKAKKRGGKGKCTKRIKMVDRNGVDEGRSERGEDR